MLNFSRPAKKGVVEGLREQQNVTRKFLELSASSFLLIFSLTFL